LPQKSPPTGGDFSTKRTGETNMPNTVDLERLLKKNGDAVVVNLAEYKEAKQTSTVAKFQTPKTANAVQALLWIFAAVFILSLLGIR
jgi:hypothetical protein